MNRIFKKIYGCAKILIMLAFVLMGSLTFTPRKVNADMRFGVVGEEKNL